MRKNGSNFSQWGTFASYGLMFLAYNSKVHPRIEKQVREYPGGKISIMLLEIYKIILPTVLYSSIELKMQAC